VRRGLAAAAAVALIALAGCGGSSDDGGGESGGGNDPFFGVVSVDAPTTTDIARMSHGGVGTFRVVLSWPAIETVEGQYDWTSTDALVGGLAREGIHPLFTALGTPPIYQQSHIDPPTNDGKTFDAWADFLKAAAERYGPDGTFWDQFAESDPGVEPTPAEAWEIWNEPNSAVFWAPAPDVDAYADLIKRSARVLKSIDPEARIMVGGMFATPQSDGAIVSYDFIDQLYQRPGVADAVDIVGIHPYGPDVESVVNQAQDMRKAIDDAGDDASIWITEMGWSSNPNGPSDQNKTPEQQGELLEKAFTKLHDRRDELGLDGLVWFTWHDSTAPIGACVWCQYSGLVDADRDTKPAWEAYARVTGGSPGSAP
jgi:hypothetical protein